MGSTDYTPFDPSVMTQCRADVRPGICMVLPRMFREMSFVPTLKDTEAQFLVSPDIGVRFGMAELFIQHGGGTRQVLPGSQLQHFLYVLEGSLDLNIEGSHATLEPGGYAWIPPHKAHEYQNCSGSLSRAVWFRRRYTEAPSFPIPDPVVGREQDIPAVLEGTAMAQYLLPFMKDPGFDSAFNLLSFGPSVCFDRAEAHIFEHGAYFVQGRGLFWINGKYYDVRVDDFVYFAPYVPHFVCAQGDEALKYLLYKNINRDIEDDLLNV